MPCLHASTLPPMPATGLPSARGKLPDNAAGRRLPNSKCVSIMLKVKLYIDEQIKLAQKVRLTPLKQSPRTIAGVDASLERFGTELFAGIIVLSYPDLKVIETVTAKAKVEFPYIPGLLSFREIPGILKCVEKLSALPSVFMVDGQGVAHPRRIGIASHLGVLLGRPTIGCAKSILTGIVEGDRLLDSRSCEILGAVIESKKNCKPLIVSPGHLITLEESVNIVKQTLRGYRLPEPTRLAHQLVNEFRKSVNKNKNGSRNK